MMLISLSMLFAQMLQSICVRQFLLACPLLEHVTVEVDQV